MSTETEAKTEVQAVTIDHKTGAVIPEETKKGIVVMSEVEAGLAEMQATYAKVPDVETDEGYEQAKSLGREVGKVRIKVDKARKAAKDFYLQGGRDIDAKAKAIAAVIGPLEDQYTKAVKVIDDRREAEEAEKAEIERERIARIESRVESIRSMPERAISLADVNECLVSLEEINTAEFGEFYGAATTHIDQATTALLAKKKALTEQAEEAARLEAQRKEQADAQAKIDAENQRIAEERAKFEEEKAAEQKASQDKLDAENKRIADERAAFEAEKQAEADKQAEAERKRVTEENNRQMKEQAEARAKREKEEAAEQAEIDKAAAVEQAKEDERKRIVAEEEAAEAQRQREAEIAVQIAAQAPDMEKINAWLASLPELPEVTTDRALAILTTLSDVIETARTESADTKKQEAA